MLSPPTPGCIVWWSALRQCSVKCLGGGAFPQAPSLIWRGQTTPPGQDWGGKRGWNLTLNGQGYLVYCSALGVCVCGGGSQNVLLNKQC